MVEYVRQTRRIPNAFTFFFVINYARTFSAFSELQKKNKIIVAKRRNVVVYFLCVSSERNHFVVEQLMIFNDIFSAIP